MPVGAREAEERPNFVIINIDDLGYGDIEPFGSVLNRTPHLNRLAEEGRKLTHFYAAPVCTPSRAALLTGCYPKRVLPIPGVLFPAAVAGLDPRERTLAEVLREAGYATGIVGKWHLGDQAEFLPGRQGFDSWVGLPYSNDMGPVEDGAKSNLGDPLPARRQGGQAADDDYGIRGMMQPPLPLILEGKVAGRVGPEEQQELVEVYTRAAEEFIRDHREKPFFLYLAHSAVHFPLYPGKEWQGKSANGLYGDWVEEMDGSVGRVLAALRAAGLEKKTLVIFTSDNGGTPRGSNGPLRGHKGSTWEGGMRVPTIAWWPGRIPAGTETEAVAAMMDVMPTLVRLAGARWQAPGRVDGVDMWPILGGAGDGRPPREVLYYFRGLRLEAVRSGPWKLRWPQGGEEAAGGSGKPVLFNLETDPGETTDLAGENTDMREKLELIAQAMEGDLGVNGVGPGCRLPGRVENPQPILGFDGTVRSDLR